MRAELLVRDGHGWFSVAVDNHTHHEVCPRDKALLTAAHRAAPYPGARAWETLPCDILHATGGACYTPDRPADAPPAPPAWD